jgi:hypothetical protein
VKRPIVLAIAAAFAAMLLIISLLRDRLAQEKLDHFNDMAAVDTSRLVYRSKSLNVHERLAFQQTQAIQLRGELGKALKDDGQKTVSLTALKVQLDSLHEVVRAGTVTTSTTDSTVRQLAASIDTAGFHASIKADVPRPPKPATVAWTIRRDPTEIIAALNRSADGRMALRAATPDASATVQVDSARVQIATNLHQTQSLAFKLLLGIGVYLLGRSHIP